MSGMPAPGSPEILSSPRPNNPGRTVAIVLAVVIPLVAVVAALGLVIRPNVLHAAPRATATVTTPTVTSSATPDITAVPAVGTCTFGPDSWDNFQDHAETIAVVPCTEQHPFETIASGTVDADARPTQTSPTAHQLFAECEAAATEFLGSPFRATLTTLVLALPSAGAWANGAHWYRCDLGALPTMDTRRPLRTTGSLKGNAEPITCLFWDVINDGTGISGVDSASCSQVHDGELAAVGTMPADVDWTDSDALLHGEVTACGVKVFDFLGVTRLPDGLTIWFSRPSGPDALDQTVLCMIAATDLNKRFTASLQGLGSNPIPFA